MSKGSDALVVYGVHPVEELLEAAPQMARVVWAKSLDDGGLGDVVGLARARGVNMRLADQAKLDRLSAGGNHQGVVLEAKAYPYANLTTEIAGWAEQERALVLILDQVQDAGNLGAILRSAAAMGVELVVVPKRRAAHVTGAVVRASAGQAFNVKVARVTNIARAMDELKAAGFWTVGTDVGAGQAPWDVDMRTKVALVMGGEHKGVRRLVGEACDFTVQIPMASGVESMNVGSATAVMLYEVRRQWSD